MKQNLLDLTFLIPIRLDTIIRLENMLLSVKYIQRHFETNILLLEADRYNNGVIEKMLNRKINYCFVEDHDPVFYRTKYLNRMTEMTITPYITIWDSDVIIPKEQIMYSIERLRTNEVDMIYPFDGHFYDISEPIRNLYLKNQSLKMLSSQILKMHLIYGNKAVGGAFMVNKQAYIESGKENENFYGWGPEDGERFWRWKNLGMRVELTPGNLYHLSHPRGMNSRIRSIHQIRQTQRELMLVQQSSKEEIQQSIYISKYL